MPPKKGTKRATSTPKRGSAPKMARESSENTKLRKAITEVKASSSKKGTFKPDALFSSLFGNKVKIVDDYACMLNQTNIGYNNNKFYVVQLGDVGGKFVCFTKWGRVGEGGQHQALESKSLEEAIKVFQKKFTDKTKNNWEKREDFVAHTGKYTMLDMDDESDAEEDVVDSSVAVNKADLQITITVSCTLDPRTQLMVKLIFNTQMFVNQMEVMELDVKKMPLGKLSKKQIAKGLEALLEIEEAIKKNKGKPELMKLASNFYTLIPHNFGRGVPAVIDTLDVVTKKKDVMMTLSDIELTQSLQKGQTSDKKIHPLDENYKMLNCDLKLMDKKTKEFKLFTKYASACTNTRKGPLLDVWSVDRKGEGERFATHNQITNRKLLWHGTNVAVVAAIMNSGLRIMPHSGGRVGKGIYFASEHAKSSWYVCPHFGSFENEKNVGFMFLVEAALGKEYHITKDHSYIAAPKGYDSVVARGRTEPDSKLDQKLHLNGNDVIVPVGEPVEQKEFHGTCFGQSEYLIYKESQARIRYLLKFSFDS